MAQLNSVEFLVAGGFSGKTYDYTDRVHIYNTNSNSWSEKSWMKLKFGPRMDASCSMVNWNLERRVLLVGGWNSSGMHVTEILDPVSERWQSVETNITNDIHSPALDHSSRSAILGELNKKPILAGGVQCLG